MSRRTDKGYHRTAILSPHQEDNIIQQKNTKNQPLITHKHTFWLHFNISGSGVEWIDAGLPTPNYIHYENNKSYYAGWQIDGFLATKQGVEYLNDTIGRIIVSMKDYKPKRLPWKPDLREAHHYYPKIRRLKEITANLPSLQTHRHAPQRADSYDDYAFWAIKLWMEDEIRAQGEGLPVVYDRLEEWALSQFMEKEQSTIKAKCRSVWNWYEKKDWALPQKAYIKKHTKEVYMTRRERALSNAKMIKEKNYKAIANLVTGMFADEYKKKNGKWNISKIAKELNIHRDTVSKHIKKNKF